MPVTFVTEGEEIQGTVDVADGAQDDRRFELHLVRLRDGEWQTLAERNVAVVVGDDDSFRYDFATGDLLRPADPFCEVRFELWVDGELHMTSDRFVVFRRRAEAHAFDAHDAPVAGAVARLVVTLHPEYLASRHRHREGENRGGTQLVYRQHTSAEGLAAFTDLPCGTWAFEWARPHLMLDPGWLAEGGFTLDGVRRKAKLSTRNITARLVFPVVGAEHRQWVNLDAAQGPVAPDAAGPNPEYGSLLRVRVAVSAPDAGLSGDVVFIKVAFDSNNSTRTGAPRPALEGIARSAVTQRAQKALAADGAEVTFDVELGVAGGDRVTLSVGGTPECADQTVTVVTWRRVVVQTVYPTGFPTPPVIAAAVRDGTIAIYRGVFVELVFDPVAIPSPHGPAYANVRAPLLAANAASLKFTATEDNLVYQNKAPEKVYIAHNGDYPAYPPKLFLIPARASLELHATETYLFNGGERQVNEQHGSTIDARVGGRSRGSITSAKGGYFLPQALDGTDIVAQYQGRASHWVDASSAERPIDHTYITVAADNKSFQFTFPSNVRDRPGVFAKTVVRLAVKTYSATAGSSSGRWIWFKSGGKDGFSKYALAHEIGHSFGQVAVQPAASGLSAQADNPYDYEYSGPHCSYGVRGLTEADRRDEVTTVTVVKQERWKPPGAKDYAMRSKEVEEEKRTAWGDRYNWADIASRGDHGPCLMFSPVGPKHTFATVDFCPVCKAFLKATNINAKLV